MNTARIFGINAFVVASVLSVSGPARADYVALPTTMDKLTPLHNYTSVGDRNFTFLNYSSLTVAQNQVAVTALSGNSSSPVIPYGFQLSGSFAASGVSASSDIALSFSVVSTGGLINSVSLFSNGSMSGSGATTVAESIFTLSSNGGQGTYLGQLNVHGSGTDSMNLGAGYTALYITKDIDAFTSSDPAGGTASISIVQQTFGEIPSVAEPTSIAMLGLGLAAAYAFARSRLKAVKIVMV